MAKSKKKDGKKDRPEEVAQRKADAAAAKARARADSLADDAKKARKAADKAVKAADRAQAEADDAARSAGRPTASRPDELSLVKLALRAAEAKLTATEHRLGQVQQQLDDERRLQDEAVTAVLEDAVVDAAVAATVEEAVLEAEVAVGAGDDDAVVVEAVAIELDEVAAQAGLPPEEPSHDGDAADAAQAFEQEGALAGEGAVSAAPPLPDAPEPGQPNEQWTLLQLRAEARRRGLTGTSNVPKAALLERLRTS